jgi:hypothetical protein
VSEAATLVGFDVPPGSRNLEIKPYVLSALTTDHAAAPSINNDPDLSGGVDVKYGVTQNLTADFTYHTDFAQVEADEQQVFRRSFFEGRYSPRPRDFGHVRQFTFEAGMDYIASVDSGQLESRQQLFSFESTARTAAPTWSVRAAQEPRHRR